MESVLIKMKTLNSVKKLALGLVVGGLFAWQAEATLAYDYSPSLPGNQIYDGWLGMTFTVNSTISVTSLGAFDAGSDGFGSATPQVAIYSIPVVGGNLDVPNGSLVSPIASFSGTSQSLISGTSVRSESISPLTLNAGVYMVVATGLTEHYNAGGNPTLVTMNTGGGLITYGWSAGAPNWFGNFANDNGGPLPGTLGNNGIFGDYWGGGGPIGRYGAGTFEFTPVPEAAGFTMAGIALLGLVYVGRVYSQRLKIA